MLKKRASFHISCAMLIWGVIFIISFIFLLRSYSPALFIVSILQKPLFEGSTITNSNITIVLGSANGSFAQASDFLAHFEFGLSLIQTILSFFGLLDNWNKARNIRQKEEKTRLKQNRIIIVGFVVTVVLHIILALIITNSIEKNTQDVEATHELFTTATSSPIQKSIQSSSEDADSSSSKAQLHGWDGSDYQYVHLGSYDFQVGIDEPIMWRVLYSDEKKALLLSEYALVARAYDQNSLTWSESDLKHWLNDIFYLHAFPNIALRNCLLTASERGTVFLLEKNDLTNSTYGFISSADAQDPNRICIASPHASNTSIWTTSGGACSYYTKTAADDTTLWMVRSNGSIGVARFDRTNVGIRPAVWLDLGKIEFDFGNGTKESPFSVN